MWNYLFFMSYLTEKEDTEYSANEVRWGVRAGEIPPAEADDLTWPGELFLLADDRTLLAGVRARPDGPTRKFVVPGGARHVPPATDRRDHRALDPD